MARDDLRYRISADTAGFDAARRKIEAGAAATGGVLNRVMSGAMALRSGGLAGLAAGAGLGATVSAMADLVNEIDDTARSAANAGVSFETFQELDYAVTHAGGASGLLGEALKEMTTRADELARTGNGPAKQAMEALGFSAADLAKMLEKPDVMLETVIGRLQALDRAAQVKFSEDIFGRQAGEEFVRLLDQSVGYIGDMRAAAQASGTVIEDRMVGTVRDLKSAWMDAGDYVKGPFMSILQNWLALLAAGVNMFRDIEDRSAASRDSALAGMSAKRLEIEEKIASLRREADGNQSLVAGAENRGIEANIAELGRQMQAISNEEKRIGAAVSARMQPDRPDVTWKPSKIENPEAAGNRAAAARDKSAAAAAREKQAVTDLIAELEYELATVMLSADERERENAVRKAGAAATAEQRDEIRDLITRRQQEEAAIKSTADAEEKLRDMTEEWADRLFDVFGEIMDGTFDAKKALAGLLLELSKALLLGKGLFANLGGGGGGAIGSLLGMLFGGGLGGAGDPWSGMRAGGGRVSGGEAYLVGERGPELFMPKTTGMIAPNAALGGSGGRVSLDITPSELFTVRVRQGAEHVVSGRLAERDATSPYRTAAALREAQARSLI